MFSIPDSWPTELNEIITEDGMSIEGYFSWADAYLDAATFLCENKKASLGTTFFIGPVVNMVGLANELILKTFLRGYGVEEKLIRRLGHSNYNAYKRIRKIKTAFDHDEFINTIIKNTENLVMPDVIREQLEITGEESPEEVWRYYPDQLRVLDTTYDRPHRSRYVTPGHIVVPEPLIILAGAKIFRDAMHKRLFSRRLRLV